MSDTHKLKISGSGPAGALHEIHVGDVLIPTITKLDLHLDATKIVTATMELIQPDGVDVETWARITLDDATVSMLKSLGWTPPVEPAPEPEPALALIDPDCRDGKCGSCIGGPCEHHCHQPAITEPSGATP